MAIIKSPNEQYTGVSAGVPFVNGIGQCDDPELLKWFERTGYTVEEAEVLDPGVGTPDTPTAPTDNPDPDKKEPDVAEKPIKPAKAEK